MDGVPTASISHLNTFQHNAPIPNLNMYSLCSVQFKKTKWPFYNQPLANINIIWPLISFKTASDYMTIKLNVTVQ